VREAQEVEGLWLDFAPLGPSLGREPAELQDAGLIGVQLQVEPAEPLPQVLQEPLCVGLVLEADHKVVRVPHDDHVTIRPCPSPLVGPQVR